MKKYILNKSFNRIVGIGLLLVLWQLIAFVVGDNRSIIPGPIETIKEVFVLLQDSYVYKCIGQTMIRMFGGFVFSFILAFILGTLAGNFKWLHNILDPTMTMLKSIPTACLVYLFLVLVGSRVTPLLVVVLISFPILYESFVAGINNIPSEIEDALSLESGGFIKDNIRIRIPLAMPYVLLGAVSTFALSFKIEIMAEVITGYTRLGLGSAILAAQRSDPTNMLPIFAYSLIAIIIMIALDFVKDCITKK